MRIFLLFLLVLSYRTVVSEPDHGVRSVPIIWREADEEVRLDQVHRVRYLRGPYPRGTDPPPTTTAPPPTTRPPPPPTRPPATPPPTAAPGPLPRTGRIAPQFAGYATAKPWQSPGFGQYGTVYGSIWAGWSHWSFCTSGHRYRVRACNTIRGFRCSGHNMQAKQCDRFGNDITIAAPTTPTTRPPTPTTTFTLPQITGDDYNVVDPWEEDRRIAQEQLYGTTQAPYETTFYTSATEVPRQRTRQRITLVGSSVATERQTETVVEKKTEAPVSQQFWHFGANTNVPTSSYNSSEQTSKSQTNYASTSSQTTAKKTPYPTSPYGRTATPGGYRRTAGPTQPRYNQQQTTARSSYGNRNYGQRPVTQAPYATPPTQPRYNQRQTTAPPSYGSRNYGQRPATQAPYAPPPTQPRYNQRQTTAPPSYGSRNYGQPPATQAPYAPRPTSGYGSQNRKQGYQLPLPNYRQPSSMQFSYHQGTATPSYGSQTGHQQTQTRHYGGQNGGSKPHDQVSYGAPSVPNAPPAIQRSYKPKEITYIGPGQNYRAVHIKPQTMSMVVVPEGQNTGGYVGGNVINKPSVPGGQGVQSYPAPPKAVATQAPVYVRPHRPTVGNPNYGSRPERVQPPTYGQQPTGKVPYGARPTAPNYGNGPNVSTPTPNHNSYGAKTTIGSYSGPSPSKSYGSDASVGTHNVNRKPPSYGGPIAPQPQPARYGGAVEAKPPGYGPQTDRNQYGNGLPTASLGFEQAKWSRWGTWSSCRCAQQARTRICEYRSPYLTQGCRGASYEIRACSESPACPKVHPAIPSYGNGFHGIAGAPDRPEGQITTPRPRTGLFTLVPPRGPRPQQGYAVRPHPYNFRRASTGNGYPRTRRQVTLTDTVLLE